MKFCNRTLLATTWILASVTSAASISLRLDANTEGHSVLLLDPKEIGKEEHRGHDEGAATSEAIARSKQTFEKVGAMREAVPRMVKQDAHEMRASFLPDLQLDLEQVVITSCATIVAVIWFFIYFQTFYKNDRDPIHQRWDAKRMEWEGTESVMQADLVLVFAHPGDEDEEQRLDTPISSKDLKNVFVANESSGGVLTRSEALVESIVAHESQEASLSVMERAGHTRQNLSHMMSMSQECKSPTKGRARTELLLDLHDAVINMGFDVDIFSSVDSDEIYMCISLKNTAVGSSYLIRDSASLQIKHSVVAALGISQPPEEIASSPPYVRYDPRIPEKLHTAGVLDSADPRRFYRTFHGRDSEGTIISGSERIRIIFKALSQHVDLDAALQEGLLETWYPAHNANWLEGFWSTWGHPSNMKDWTFVQPLEKLRQYFGSRVSFIYGWNGFYCKALLPLSALSLLAECIALVCQMFLGMDMAHVNRKLIFSFGIVIIIWSRIASNLWDREQTILMKLWDLNPESEEFNVRPSFKGELLPSPSNLKVREKQYPAHQAAIRRCVTETITMVFCGLVFLWVVAWTNMFQGQMDIYASVSLSLQIVIFGVGWNQLTPVLTDWENHKYQNTYYDSYLWKQCFFQTVNNYTAFFYLAVKQRYTAAGCPEGGCMMVLRTQLIMTLIILAVSAMAQVVINGLLVKLSLYLEDRKEVSKGATRFFTEEQSKLADFRLREQIQAMVQLVISLGFVLLFGAVAPVTVPLCLLVFMVQMRASAYMLLTYTKRPIPRKQFGIGRWREVIQIFMRANVIFTGILAINYSMVLRNSAMITKMTVVVLFYLGSQVIWTLVDIVFPAHNNDIAVLNARRKCTLNAVARRCEKVKADMIAGMSPRSPGGPLAKRSVESAKALKEGNWAAIPFLQELAGKGVTPRSGRSEPTP